MLTKNEIKSYARVLVWSLKEARTSKFEKYDAVLIRYDFEAAELADAVYEILLREKMNPVLQALNSENSAKSFYEISDGKQLKNLPGWQLEMNKSLNGLVVIRAPRDLYHLKNADPKKIALSALARKPVKEILDAREAAGKFSWTLCSYPTAALAESSFMSVGDYAAQIKKACYLDEKDPVKKWQRVYKDMKEISLWLSSLKIETLNTRTANMDLTVNLGESRKFISARGCNMPSFEIFTSPDWRGARGTYYADMKSLRSGVIIEKIKLEFKGGRVVKSSAAAGADYLKKMLSMDRGASRIGEYSLTDARFSKIDRFMADTLFDENFGGGHGNCHIALGSSYADAFSGDVKKLDKKRKAALGFNDSSLHWDIINTEPKTVKARLKTGKTVTIYENGQFKF